MSIKKLLGLRIKELRKVKGFTQDKLSEIVGVDPKHLSRIECGINFPSLDLLEKISQALGIDASLLLTVDHIKDKKTLINNINKILATKSLEEIRIFYKILVSMTN